MRAIITGFTKVLAHCGAVFRNLNHPGNIIEKLVRTALGGACWRCRWELSLKRRSQSRMETLLLREDQTAYRQGSSLKTWSRSSVALPGFRNSKLRLGSVLLRPLI